MMALKSYEELRKIDVRPFCKKRDREWKFQSLME